MIHPAIPRLASLCSQWGGALELLSIDEWEAIFDPPWRGYSVAPFTSGHGIHWASKVVYALNEDADPGTIVHEMGHVFACGIDPHHDFETREFSWFGWEIALARQVRCFAHWSEGNRDYQIRNDGTKWGRLTGREQAECIKDRLEHARRIGILDDNLRPRAIR